MALGERAGGDRYSQPRNRGLSPAEMGVESNSRLTGATGAVLFVLFAIEGATLLSIGAHINLHVFVGMLLVPPALVKMGSTGWRFARYYSGSPPYRRKGPPPALLRMLGPFVVILTVVLLGSGIALVLDQHALGDRLLFIHQASFVLWFGAMTIHVLGHIAETAKLAPMDWIRRSRRQVAGASTRQWVVLSSLVVGAILGALMLGPASHYIPHHHFH